MNIYRINNLALVLFLCSFYLVQAQELPAPKKTRFIDHQLQDFLDRYDPTIYRCRPAIRLINDQAVEVGQDESLHITNDQPNGTLACMLAGFKNVTFDMAPVELDHDVRQLLQRYPIGVINYHAHFEHEFFEDVEVGLNTQIWFTQGGKNNAMRILKGTIESMTVRDLPYEYIISRLAGYSENDIRAFYRRQNSEGKFERDREAFNAWLQANTPEVVQRWVDEHTDEFNIEFGLLGNYQPPALPSESEEEVSGSESEDIE